MNGDIFFSERTGWRLRRAGFPGSAPLEDAAPFRTAFGSPNRNHKRQRREPTPAWGSAPGNEIERNTRAESPPHSIGPSALSVFSATIPGALPQAGLSPRLWRFGSRSHDLRASHDRCKAPLAPIVGICRRAFSLIEVVVAVGIFAVGMVAVIGLFAPVARSVGGASDAEAAARVAESLRIKLQGMPWDQVITLLKNTTATSHELSVADARIDYDISKDVQLLFANRDGTKIGRYGDPIWLNPGTRRHPDADKFFEIALIRNEAISPKPGTTTTAEGAAVTINPDATAALLAYTARLRWPAFIPDGAAGAIQVGSNPNATVRFDHSKKQVLHVSGAVTR